MQIEGMSIIAYRGDTINVTFDFDSEIVFVSGDKVKLTVKRHKAETTALIEKEYSVEPDQTELFVELSKNETALDTGFYYYDLVLISGTQRQTLGVGSIIIKGVVHSVE